MRTALSARANLTFREINDVNTRAFSQSAPIG